MVQPCAQCRSPLRQEASSLCPRLSVSLFLSASFSLLPVSLLTPPNPHPPIPPILWGVISSRTPTASRRPGTADNTNCRCRFGNCPEHPGHTDQTPRVAHLRSARGGRRRGEKSWGVGVGGGPSVTLRKISEQEWSAPLPRPRALAPRPLGSLEREQDRERDLQSPGHLHPLP